MSAFNELNRQRNNVLADASALLARGLKGSESKRSFENLLTQADRLGSQASIVERAERSGGCRHRITVAVERKPRSQASRSEFRISSRAVEWAPTRCTRATCLDHY